MEGLTFNPKSVLEKYDATPLQNSDNLVSSGAVYTYGQGIRTSLEAADAVLGGRIDTLASQLATPIVFKGSSTYAALPSSGNNINDTYYVTDSDKMCWYTWNGTAWAQSSLSVVDYEGIILQLKKNDANLYSDQSTYNVGDYVVNPSDSKLYICTTQISTAEAFNSSHWAETNLGSDLSVNKTIIDTYNSIVDYGYDIPCDIGVTGTTPAARCAVSRRREQLVLNRDYVPSSGASNVYIRLTGEVARTSAAATVRGWSSGIYLTEGHEYRMTTTLVSGSSTVDGETFVCSPSCIPVGSDDTLTKDFYRQGNCAVRTFIAGSTQCNIVLYVAHRTLFTDAKYVLILEDITYEPKYVTETTYNDDILDVYEAIDSVPATVLGTDVIVDPDYEPMLYLQSNAHQYVVLSDPLTIVKSNTRVVCDFQMTALDATSSYEYVFGVRAKSTGVRFGFGVGSEGEWVTPYYLTNHETEFQADLNRHTVDFGPDGCILDGVTIADYHETGQDFSGISTRAISCFALSDHAQSSARYFTSACKIFSVHIYEGDTLVRHLLPGIRKSDSMPVLYDTVSRSAYISYTDDPSYGVLVGSSISVVDMMSTLSTSVDEQITQLTSYVDSAVSGIHSIPPYVYTEVDRVSNLVRSVQGPHTLTVIALSDMHYKQNDNNIISGLTDMRDAASLFKNQVHVDYGICFGDLLWRLAADANFDIGKYEVTQATKLVTEAFEGLPSIRLVGNHDADVDGDLHFSHQQKYSYFGIFNDWTENPGYEDRSYGYIDDAKKKIRIICLNTTATSANYGIQADQLQWLAQTLDLSAKSDAASWKIILTSHVYFDSNTKPSTSSPYRKHMAIIDAYLNGTSFSYTYSGTTISYDYTNKNTAELLLNINGHSHKYDVVNMYNNNSELMSLVGFTVPNALPDRESESFNGVTYTKTIGTKDSTSFQVYVIDPTTHTVYAYHYGAGVDIVSHLTPIQVNTTYTLSTTIASPVWFTQDSTKCSVEAGVVTRLASGYTNVYAKSETDNIVECWNIQCIDS